MRTDEQDRDPQDDEGHDRRTDPTGTDPSGTDTGHLAAPGPDLVDDDDRTAGARRGRAPCCARAP